MRLWRRNDHKLVAVLGAGGTGLYVASRVRQTDGYEFAGFLDDDVSKRAHGYEGLRVLGAIADWAELDAQLLFLSSLYGAKTMARFHELVESLNIPTERWATVVDQRAVVCAGARIGEGSFVGPGSVLEPAACVGARCALLGNVYVAHHSVLGEYVACANSASIAGGVRIGHASYIGANASVHQYVEIGAHAVVGMGAVVLDGVASGTTVVGNPGQVLQMPR